MENIAIYELVILALVGVLSGWMNVIAGGGSLLTLPIMLFMGISAPVANGTNRIGIVMQNIAAIYSFFRRGFADFKLSLSLAFFAAMGAVLGANLGVKLDGDVFNYLLAGVMVVVMILTSTKADKAFDNPVGTKKRVILGHILMIGAGFWGGLIQVGVGFILMPILNRVMGLDLVRTNMHKVFIALVFSSVAIYIFSSSVGVLWQVGIALGLGTMIGGYLGAHTAVKKGENFIRTVLQIVLGIFIVKLLFF
jgi:uncharacterized membrane protein YfcA